MEAVYAHSERNTYPTQPNGRLNATRGRIASSIGGQLQRNFGYIIERYTPTLNITKPSERRSEELIMDYSLKQMKWTRNLVEIQVALTLLPLCIYIAPSPTTSISVGAGMPSVIYVWGWCGLSCILHVSGARLTVHSTANYHGWCPCVRCLFGGSTVWPV